MIGFGENATHIYVFSVELIRRNILGKVKKNKLSKNQVNFWILRPRQFSAITKNVGKEVGKFKLFYRKLINEGACATRFWLMGGYTFERSGGLSPA